MPILPKVTYIMRAGDRIIFKAENRALGKSMGIIEVAAPTKAANTRRKMRLLRLSIFAVMHSTRKSIAKFTAR